MIRSSVRTAKVNSWELEQSKRTLSATRCLRNLQEAHKSFRHSYLSQNSLLINARINLGHKLFRNKMFFSVRLRKLNDNSFSRKIRIATAYVRHLVCRTGHRLSLSRQILQRYTAIRTVRAQQNLAKTRQNKNSTFLMTLLNRTFSRQ